MPKKFLFSLLFFFMCLSLLTVGQGTKFFVLSGNIQDSTSSEALGFTEISVEGTNIITFADENGAYNLKVPEGTITVNYSIIGYAPIKKKVNISSNKTIQISMSPVKDVSKELEVVTNAFKDKLNTTQMSTEKVTIEEAKAIPALMGEVDIIKVFQLKPGIQSGFEGSSGLYVRGGGADQNLVMYDNSVVYNPSHLFGLFSVFNSDVVKDAEVYKAGFPAKYGGRLSSILQVNTINGNYNKLSGSGGIGLISSRGTLTGPIKKDKASFLISGRRTYFDIFTGMINSGQKDNPEFSPIPGYFFYDLNAKVDYKIGKKDWLILGAYIGEDKFNFEDGEFDFKFKWGNKTASLAWAHEFNSNFFSKTSVSYTNYEYELDNTFDIFSFELGSKIKDYNFKSDFSYYLKKHKIKFGVNYTYHDFTISRIKVDSEDDSFNFGDNILTGAQEMGIYISDEFTLSDKFRINYGLRGSGFYKSEKFYMGLEPRLAARYLINNKWALKVSYARMYQYLHLISSSGSSLPTDIWFPSTKDVKPQVSDMVAAGVSTTLLDGKLFFSNEVYYKWLDNQVDFKDNAQLFLNPNLEDEFVFGRGRGYGFETYVEKKKGKTTGWIGYTLAWAPRWFDDLNNGERMYPRYDRRHDASLVVMHKLSKKITLSGSWIYGTGVRTTLPFERIDLQGPSGAGNMFTPVFTDRNNYRLPAYHRMDLAMIIKFSPKWGESDLTISIYNAYSRRNTYFLYYEEELDDNNNITKYTAKQVALFPIIPSVTYNFKF